MPMSNLGLLIKNNLTKSPYYRGILSNKYKSKNVSKKTWDHEYGHTRDSRMFGPLYLIVIGLPSIIWAWMYGTIIKPTQNGYYKFYTEKRADRLGGVER